MNRKRGGLGRGLGALIPQEAAATGAQSEAQPLVPPETAEELVATGAI